MSIHFDYNLWGGACRGVGGVSLGRNRGDLLFIVLLESLVLSKVLFFTWGIEEERGPGLGAATCGRTSFSILFLMSENLSSITTSMVVERLISSLTELRYSGSLLQRTAKSVIRSAVISLPFIIWSLILAFASRAVWESGLDAFFGRPLMPGS